MDPSHLSGERDITLKFLTPVTPVLHNESNCSGASDFSVFWLWGVGKTRDFGPQYFKELYGCMKVYRTEYYGRTIFLGTWAGQNVIFRRSFV